MYRYARLKQVLKAAWDCWSWLVAIGLVVVARYGSDLDASQRRSVLLYAAAVCAVQLTVGIALKAYRGGFRAGSFEEALGLALAVSIAGLVSGAALLSLAGMDALPVGLAVLAPPIALVLIVAGRLAYRAYKIRTRGTSAQAERVIVYGAGELGHQLIRLIDTDRSGPYRVVAIIDDNPRRGNLKLRGVCVRGTRADLAVVARQYRATTVILAIGSADAQMVREVEQVVVGAGLTFKVVPHLTEIIGGKVALSDVRDVSVCDLLGRRQIETDLGSVAGYITGRRVLVTGAGGSIGSELARQVHKLGPAELALLDRDESGLHGVQLSIYGNALLDTPDMVLADIRDKEALRRVFEAHRPEVVFHAGALKHLPMLEQYPEEGWKTNVLGTLNVLELAAEFGVRQFVNVSTDKAADPTSVLGWTKRQAERLTAWHAWHAEGTFLSVRFGNVLGSRGSMLHTFREQIERGGPVTVTHPDITRYFMTIPEACQLVIQAGGIGRGGEVLVLDMGEPVKIHDVAQRLIASSGKAVEIVFTGIRPGEKMHEDLFSTGELGERPFHPLISHVRVPALAPVSLDDVHATRELANGRVLDLHTV